MDDKTYKVGKDVYTIPSDKSGDFLKDNPDATEVNSFVLGKDTLDIPTHEVESFLKDNPDATPLSQKKSPKITTTPSSSFTEAVGQSESVTPSTSITVPLKTKEQLQKESIDNHDLSKKTVVADKLKQVVATKDNPVYVDEFKKNLIKQGFDKAQIQTVSDNTLKAKNTLPKLINDVNVEPNNPQKSYELGNAFSATGDYDKAIASYNNALSHSTEQNNAQAIPNQLAPAEEQQTQIPASQDQANTLSGLGYAMLHKGDTKGAIDAYTQAVKVNPNNETALKGLAYTQYITGDKQGSKQTFKDAINAQTLNNSAESLSIQIGEEAKSNIQKQNDLKTAESLNIADLTDAMLMNLPSDAISGAKVGLSKAWEGVKGVNEAKDLYGQVEQGAKAVAGTSQAIFSALGLISPELAGFNALTKSAKSLPEEYKSDIVSIISPLSVALPKDKQAEQFDMAIDLPFALTGTMAKVFGKDLKEGSLLKSASEIIDVVIPIGAHKLMEIRNKIADKTATPEEVQQYKDATQTLSDLTPTELKEQAEKEGYKNLAKNVENIIQNPKLSPKEQELHNKIADIQTDLDNPKVTDKIPLQEALQKYNSDLSEHNLGSINDAFDSSHNEAEIKTTEDNLKNAESETSKQIFAEQLDKQKLQRRIFNQEKNDKTNSPNRVVETSPEEVKKPAKSDDYIRTSFQDYANDKGEIPYSKVVEKTEHPTSNFKGDDVNDLVKRLEDNGFKVTDVPKVEGSGVGGDVKPIRQLGTGDNVYFETNKYRVNDWRNGKVLLNVGNANNEVPLANIQFDTTNEAVFVAKKLQENAPEGLISDYHNVDKIIERFKEEYKQSLKETPQAGSGVEPTEKVSDERIDGADGNAGTVKFAHNISHPFTYRLVEAEDLQPSHLPSGERNPEHRIALAQPKERTDQASLLAQDAIASNPSFNEVGEDKDVYGGAPIVNERGEVIQGNNRSIGLKKHYDQNKTQYKDDLANNAEKFGFTKEQVDGMKNPVLVREVRADDQQAISLGQYDVKDMETGGKQRIDPVTTSRKMSAEDKKALSDILFTGDHKTLKDAIRANKDKVVAIFKKNINPSQIADLLTKEGDLTSNGMDAIHETVRNFLFDNGDARLPSMFDGLPYTVQKGIEKAIPHILSIEGNKSILHEVQGAIIALHNFYNSAEGREGKFDQWMNDVDIFENKNPKELFTPLELRLAKDFTKAKNQVDISNIFAKFAENINGKKAENDLFLKGEDIEPLSKGEAIKQQFNIDYNERQNIKLPSNEGDLGQVQKKNGTAKPADAKDNATPKPKSTGQPEGKGSDVVGNKGKEGETERIKPKSKFIETTSDYRTADVGNHEGQQEFENVPKDGSKIDKSKGNQTELKKQQTENILNGNVRLDADTNGEGGKGETGKQAFGRIISRFIKDKETQPDGTAIVAHSSVLKAIKTYEELKDSPNFKGADWSKLTDAQYKEFAEKYIKQSTENGDIETFDSKNGKIHVVRHGQTEDNLTGKFRDDNTQLTDKGRKQAKESGQQLSKDTPKIISSDFDRAVETSNIISDEIGKEKPKEEKKVEEEPSSEKHIGIAKANREDINGMLEHFEPSDKKHWEQTSEEALTDLAKNGDSKDEMYNEAQTKLEKWNNKENFNPTDVDLAQMMYHRKITLEKVKELKDDLLNTDADIRKNAEAKYEILKNNLELNSKVLKETGTTAGRSFAFRQAMAKMDAKNGLDLKRMEVRSATGEKLTQEQDEKLRQIQSDYDKKVKEISDTLKKDYNESLKKIVDDLTKKYEQSLKDRPPINGEGKRFKLSDTEKKRKAELYGKLSGRFNDLTNIATLLGDKDFYEYSKLLFKEVAGKFEDFAKEIGDKFKKIPQDVTKDLWEHLNKENDPLEKIKEVADKEKPVLTKEMVGKGYITDVLRANIDSGLRGDKALEQTHKDLQTIFGKNFTREQLHDALLKQGEYYLEPKSKIIEESDIAERTAKKLGGLQNKLKGLEERKETWQRKNKGVEKTPMDKEIEQTQKQIDSELNKQQKKIDKSKVDVKKDKIDLAERHNKRIDDLIKSINTKIAESGESASEGLKSIILLLKDSKFDTKTIDDMFLKTKDALPKIDNALSELQYSPEYKDIYKEVRKSYYDLKKDIENTEREINIKKYNDSAERTIKKNKKIIERGEFTEPQMSRPDKLGNATIEMELAKNRSSKEVKRIIQKAFESKKSKTTKALEFVYNAWLAQMIGHLKTAGVVGVASVVKQPIETATRVATNKITDVLHPTLKSAAESEGLSVRQEKLRYQAMYRAIGQEKMQQKIENSLQNLDNADREYQKALDKAEELKYKGLSGKTGATSVEYQKYVKNELQKAKDKLTGATLNHLGNIMYNWIGSNSYKDASDVLMKGASTLEHLLGEKGQVDFKDLDRLEQVKHVMNIMGVLHGSMKNFSARGEFAAEFMARLENKAKKGIDIRNPSEIIKTIADSYVSFDRGRFQQDNLLVKNWNKFLEAKSKDDGLFGELARTALKSQQPVLRTSSNIMGEAILNYSLGALIAPYREGDLKVRAYKEARAEGAESVSEIYKAMQDKIKQTDPEVAASIMRAYRKGGFGALGWVLGISGIIKFGGFWSDDDKDKDKGIVQIGDTKLGKFWSTVVMHSPIAVPALMASNFLRVRNNELKKGNSEISADVKGIVQDIKDIESVIPFLHDSNVGANLKKTTIPLVGDLSQDISVLRDTDEQGNPISRKTNYNDSFWKGLEDQFKLNLGINRQSVSKSDVVNAESRLTSKEHKNSAMTKFEQKTEKKEKAKELKDKKYNTIQDIESDNSLSEDQKYKLKKLLKGKQKSPFSTK